MVNRSSPTAAASRYLKRNRETVKKGACGTLCHSLDCKPNSPLWERVPTKDASGEYLGDFMMIIPGLKSCRQDKRKDILNKLSDVIEYYEEVIVFADLNMKMNLLWVSIKPVKGMFVEIPAAIIAALPEAKLISDRPAG